MEMTYKIKDIRKVFPIYSVRDGILLSKRGDITFGWKITYPAAFSVSEQEYDDLLNSIASAVRMLPEWCIVHKQDCYFEKNYEPSAPDSFLGECNSRHFAGRKYLEHESYLFLTFSNGNEVRRSAAGSSVFGCRTSAASSYDKVSGYVAIAEQFISLIESSGIVRAERLDDADFRGDDSGAGIIQRYMMLGGTGVLSDIALSGGKIGAGSARAAAYIVSDLAQLPGEIRSCMKYDSLSYQQSEILVSNGFPIGIGLDCEHIVNHYILTVPQSKFIKDLETRKRHMNNLGSISKENQVFAKEIEDFMGASVKESVTIVLSHLNVFVIGREESEFNGLCNDAVSKFVRMNISAVRNMANTPCQYFAGIPGAEAELGYEEYMPMEVTSALCMGCYETFDTGVPGGRLKFCDRLRHIPLPMDFSDRAASLDFITNFNIMMFGKSGSGKSFTMNDFLRQNYDAGADIVLLDVGDSYEGLCGVIRSESNGKDGIYYSYDPDRPFSFNPFSGWEKWGETDNMGETFLLALLQTIWTPYGGWRDASENILMQTVREFLSVYCPQAGIETPVMGDYYFFLSGIVRPQVTAGAYTHAGSPVTKDKLDLDEFCDALCEFGFEGKYSYLLNDRTSKDIMSGRFTVFEVDKVSKDRKTYPIWLLCIMHSFEEKMRSGKGYKMLVIEEAWKAVTNKTTASYMAWLWRTARKFNTSAVVVTQQAEDILDNDIIKGAILHNSDIKIILDPGNSRNTFGETAKVLGLSKKETGLVLSINRNNDPRYLYREIFISLGGIRYGVFGVETSREEAAAYESKKTKKSDLLELAETTGDYVEAIRRLCQ